jgi:hypothetical protein
MTCHFPGVIETIYKRYQPLQSVSRYSHRAHYEYKSETLPPRTNWCVINIVFNYTKSTQGLKVWIWSIWLRRKSNSEQILWTQRNVDDFLYRWATIILSEGCTTKLFNHRLSIISPWRLCIRMGPCGTITWCRNFSIICKAKQNSRCQIGDKSEFRIEYLRILGATIANLVSPATWTPLYVYPYTRKLSWVSEILSKKEFLKNTLLYVE